MNRTFQLAVRSPLALQMQSDRASTFISCPSFPSSAVTAQTGLAQKNVWFCRKHDSGKSQGKPRFHRQLCKQGASVTNKSLKLGLWEVWIAPFISGHPNAPGKAQHLLCQPWFAAFHSTY